MITSCAEERSGSFFLHADRVVHRIKGWLCFRSSLARNKPDRIFWVISNPVTSVSIVAYYQLCMLELGDILVLNRYKSILFVPVMILR